MISIPCTPQAISLNDSGAQEVSNFKVQPSSLSSLARFQIAPYVFSNLAKDYVARFDIRSQAD